MRLWCSIFDDGPATKSSPCQVDFRDDSASEISEPTARSLKTVTRIDLVSVTVHSILRSGDFGRLFFRRCVITWASKTQVGYSTARHGRISKSESIKSSIRVLCHPTLPRHSRVIWSLLWCCLPKCFVAPKPFRKLAFWYIVRIFLLFPVRYWRLRTSLGKVVSAVNLRCMALYLRAMYKLPSLM